MCARIGKDAVMQTLPGVPIDDVIAELQAMKAAGYQSVVIGAPGEAWYSFKVRGEVPATPDEPAFLIEYERL
jgi:hypothetical protein